MIKTEFGTELKKKLLKGINKLNDSVSSTLGPAGRNVIIREADGSIKVTKDGVTVAKAFSKLEDPV
jgi:chaperonin GroEL